MYQVVWKLPSTKKGIYMSDFRDSYTSVDLFSRRSRCHPPSCQACKSDAKIHSKGDLMPASWTTHAHGQQILPRNHLREVYGALGASGEAFLQLPRNPLKAIDR